MNFNEYQVLAHNTSANKKQMDCVVNGVMGMNGEAGECIDTVKKHMFQGHPLDEAKLVKEMGDVLWYIAETCTGLGIGMQEVAERNIAKLKNRYPQGFDSERSMHRKEGDI